jgi:hypothetical protein
MNSIPIEQLLEQVSMASVKVNSYESDMVQKIRRILFNDRSIIGLSDFLHLNPSLPNRELSGLMRLQKINEFLASLTFNKTSLKIVPIVYDHTLPRSEASREGGGFGFLTGTLKKTIPIIECPDRHYRKQRPIAINCLDYTEQGVKRLHLWYPDIPESFLSSHLNDSLWIFNLYNEGIGIKEKNAATHIVEFKKAVYRRIGIDGEYEWSLLSNQYDKMAMVLEELIYRGIQWQSLPLGNLKQSLFTIIDELGHNVGKILPNGYSSALACYDNKQLRWSWEQVLAALRKGQLIPSIELYFLIFILTPAWLHFGNLYDHHFKVCHWFYDKNPNYPRFIRLGEDGDNSIPLGETFIRGRHSRTLLLIDLLLRSRTEIMIAIQRTAELGFPYWKSVKFREELHNLLINKPEHNELAKSTN